MFLVSPSSRGVIPTVDPRANTRTRKGRWEKSVEDDTVKPAKLKDRATLDSRIVDLELYVKPYADNTFEMSSH